MAAEQLLNFADEDVLEFTDEDLLEFEDAETAAARAKVARRTESVFVLDPEPAASQAPEVVTGMVREWHQHADESLPQIHETIDAWGRVERLDISELEARVDKLTRHVKSREVVFQETVTEYVDVPVEGTGKSPAPKAAKHKSRLLGFFGPRKAKQAVDAAVAARHPGSPEYQPQCSALTADDAQCRNSARGDSKYCISHKGYQPPTAKGIAKRVEGEAWDPRDKITDRSTVRKADTRPAVGKAKDTTLSTRKATKNKKSGRKKR